MLAEVESAQVFEVSNLRSKLALAVQFDSIRNDPKTPYKIGGTIYYREATETKD